MSGLKNQKKKKKKKKKKKLQSLINNIPFLVLKEK